MQTATQTASVSKGRLWAGRAMSALVIFFLILDGAMKLVKPAPVLQAFAKLGYPGSLAVGIGVLLLACVALYALPRTSILGAILLTGYLGDAVASHVRIGDPWFSHALFPTYVGVLAWVGLFLREDRLRVLVPRRS